MTARPTLEAIYPFFIVRDTPCAIKFYEERLGFVTRFAEPQDNPFFAIVGRDGVQIFLKSVSGSVAAEPNHTRNKEALWDAFVYVEDPDALASEFAARGVVFHQAITDRSDNLRGFEVADSDGYILFFGRPL